MPRDGSGIYNQPFPDVVTGTTIESAVFNGNTADVEQDLNTPRPIVAGGTGANNAKDARIALGAETAMATVTNYDSHVWENGSFWSAPGVTAAPLPGRTFAGTCIVGDNNPNFITLEVRTLDTTLPVAAFYRQKTDGAWGAWTQEISSLADTDARYVNLAGDTMTGNLAITRAVGDYKISFAYPGVRAWGLAVTGTGGFTIDDISAGAARLAIDIGGNTSIGGALTANGITSSGRMYANAGLSVSGGTLSVSGQETVHSQVQNGIRHTYGNYGVIQHNTGVYWHLLVTNSGDPIGNFNTLRPFYFNLATGNVLMGHDVAIVGTATVGAMESGGNITSGGTISSGSLGRIMSTRNSDSPSVTVWNQSRGAASAFWLGDRTYIGTADGSGNPGSSFCDFALVGGVYRFHTSDAQKTGGGPFNSISDERIKTVTGEYTSGLDEILALQPVRYTFKGNDTDGPPSNSSLGATPDLEADTRNVPQAPYPNSAHYTAATEGQEFIGLIAQQAEVSMPELVRQGEAYIDGVQVTDMRTLDTSPLVFALINAVKELKSEVDALKAAR